MIASELEDAVAAALALCLRLEERPDVALPQSRECIIARILSTTGSLTRPDFNSYVSGRLEPLLLMDFNLRHPRYVGHMTKPVDPALISIALVISFANANTVKTETARVMTEVERQRIGDWHSLIYGQESYGAE